MFLSFKSEWVGVVWVSPNPFFSFFLLWNIMLHSSRVFVKKR